MLAICRESARETDEKRCSSERARPDGVRRLGGKRVSSQLPQLPKQKGSLRIPTKSPGHSEMMSPGVPT
jgi:hypothetical protein